MCHVVMTSINIRCPRQWKSSVGLPDVDVETAQHFVFERFCIRTLFCLVAGFWQHLPSDVYIASDASTHVYKLYCLHGFPTALANGDLVAGCSRRYVYRVLHV